MTSNQSWEGRARSSIGFCFLSTAGSAAKSCANQAGIRKQGEQDAVSIPGELGGVGTMARDGGQASLDEGQRAAEEVQEGDKDEDAAHGPSRGTHFSGVNSGFLCPYMYPSSIIRSLFVS